VQRLLQSVSPAHGRILIYVWAVEQDELSKRIVPQDGPQPEHPGRDVFVPWVMPAKGAQGQDGAEPQARVFERYYHMFAKGELRAMVEDAAREMGLEVCSRDKSKGEAGCGVEVMHDGWERSNYYVELRRWTFHT
jgi:tRNA (uracil-5-)-methyltransferase TRM9